MKAIVSAEGRFSMATVTEPHRDSSDAVLVEVEVVSLNRGETTVNWQSGQTVGWDAFGTILEESADGLGPTAGTRVATWGFSGAWAQKRVVSRHNLAVVPGSVSAATAAALPVAGLTALGAVNAAGVGPGIRLAVTGASGGVGHLAVQLAADAGASVLAFTREPALITKLLPDTDGLDIEVLDANHVHPGEDLGAVIDTVGGPILAALTQHLSDSATVVMVGAAAGEKVTLDTAALTSRRIRLLSVDIPMPVGAGLTHLIRLIAAGRIKVDTSESGSWERLVSSAPADLLGPGKMVFQVA